MTTKQTVKTKKQYRLLLMALPFMIIVFLFAYVPIMGWIFAFFDYIPGVPLLKCEFVGLDYFKLMFRDSGNLIRVMKNTLIFAVIGILITPLPMIFAILLNEIKSGPIRRAIQTFTTLPNFISMVIVFSLAFSLFSNDGLLNSILLFFGVPQEKLSSVMGDGSAVYWFQPFLGIWKTLGWSSIIYLAAIAGIDQEMYEAAMVDGAGKLKCAMYITLPALAETYFVLLILGIGNFLNTGFEQYFLFKNPMTAANIEVLDLYVYRIGLVTQDYSYGIAIGIIKSIISISLLFLANGLSKKIRKTAII